MSKNGEVASSSLTVGARLKADIFEKENAGFSFAQKRDIMFSTNRDLWRQMYMNKDWLFTTDEHICGLRTVAVLVKDNKILVQRDRNGNEYALPGGHIKIGESLEDGLIREAMEEMGVAIKCNRLLWSEECFWKWNSKQAHYIVFYYLAELCENQEIPDNREFVSQKDNGNVVLGWIPIEELQNIIIYPEFLKKEICFLNEPMKHFVSKG